MLTYAGEELPSQHTKVKLLQYIADTGLTDSSLEVKKLSEEIQHMCT